MLVRLWGCSPTIDPEFVTGTTPIRSCIGCRRKAPQHELTRIGRRTDGSLAVSRTLPGRGAWLCAGSLPCFELAVRRRAFSKALRATVDEHDIERVRTEFIQSGSAARD